MSRVDKCFVCGWSLRNRERRRVEVRDADGRGPVTRYCMVCWRFVREALKRHADPAGMDYSAKVRIWRGRQVDEEG